MKMWASEQPSPSNTRNACAVGSADKELNAIRHSIYFDEVFYLEANPDIKASGFDPAEHYLRFGAFEGRNPGPFFFTKEYLDMNPDVAIEKMNPLSHYELYGRYEGRGRHILPTLLDSALNSQKPYSIIGALRGSLKLRYFELLCTLGKTFKNAKLRKRGEAYFFAQSEDRAARLKFILDHASDFLTDSQVFTIVQNRVFPVDLYNSEKIMVIIVPEHNAMSGGIYSFFAIADQMRRLRKYHGYDVILMTRPVPNRLTYFRNTNFRNHENIYRFEQILLCKSAKEIYLHIPEYETEFFAKDISNEEHEYLLSREKVDINILNQNIKLMPEKERFSDLRGISHSISQSVAHHAYFNQAIADKYDLPTLLLPPFTDLSAYMPTSFEEKEKLIIYSPDDASYKAKCLEQISQNFPEFTLIEIRDITFDRFMDYATRCLFSITFGEGFDGYLAQPIHQGGIGFAVYDDRFFPSSHFKQYLNIFNDADEMINCICDRIQFLLNDRPAYVKLNDQFRKEYHKLYRYEEYVDQIKKLALKQFEVFPKIQA